MSLPAAVTVEFDAAPAADALLSQELADLVGLDLTEEWPTAPAHQPPETAAPPLGLPAATPPATAVRPEATRVEAFAFRGVVVARAGRELLGWARLLQPPGESAAVVFDHILAAGVRRRLATGRYATERGAPEPADEIALLTLLLRHAASHAKELGFATINWSGPDTSPIGRAADELGARVDAVLGRHWTVPDLRAWTPPSALPEVTLHRTPRPFPPCPHPTVEAYVQLYNDVHAEDEHPADTVPDDLAQLVAGQRPDGAVARRPADVAEVEPAWDAAGIDAYLADRAPQGHVLDLLAPDGTLTAQLAAGLLDGRALLEVTAPRDAAPSELAAGIAGLIDHLRADEAQAADLDIREIADPPLRRAAELLGARITSRWQAYALTL
ncbi:hypothetical protein ACMA1D_04690 [Streptomyces sp. 796.1]|uniref:hypothetical protein n=1 Tax=Streptomyces sp. 796.1 TaxID=3163029 RepID=UPI0039C9D1CA